MLEGLRANRGGGVLKAEKEGVCVREVLERDGAD